MAVLRMGRADDFLEVLRHRLSDETMRHSVSAALFMVSHREKMGVDGEKAVTTGLLHDLAKDLAHEELLAAAKQYGIPIRDVHIANPGLLHGPVAAEECRARLNMHDEEMYEAIYWHTTGRPELGKLGLALYLADFAEPFRSVPQAAVARRILATESFEKAVLFVAGQKLEHVSKKLTIDPVSETFHSWLLERFGGG